MTEKYVESFVVVKWRCHGHRGQQRNRAQTRLPHERLSQLSLLLDTLELPFAIGPPPQQALNSYHGDALR